MPIRRQSGGLSTSGNLFDRPGFFDYGEIERLTVDTSLILQAASETYGVSITHAEQSADRTINVPALAANGDIVITNATQTLTNKTLTNLRLSEILDTGGNELFKFTATSNAVNEITLTNATTTNPPVFSATGSDTNIDIKFQPKGSGKVIITGDIDVQGTSTTINSTTLDVDDKNIVMGSVGSPSDSTADGGGITLKGASDKTIIWDNTNDNWTSNQDWNISTGKVFRINNVSMLSNTTLGSTVINSSLTSTGILAGGSIASGFGAISTGNAITTTAAITGGSLVVDSITIDGDTISSTGAINFAATTSLDFGDKSVLNIGNLTVDAIYGDNNAIAIGDNSDDAVSIYRVNALTAIGDLDIGTHDFKAATLTTDTLGAGRIVYTGTGGVLAAESGFEYNASSNVVTIPTLTATNINAFALGGKLTAGSNEIEGSNFDITGGTVAGVTATSFTLNSGSVGGSLSWGAGQNLGNHSLSNVNVDSGTLNGITALGIVESGGGSEMQIAVTQNLTADRVLTINMNNAARTLATSGDLTFGNAFTTGSHALTLTTTGTTNVTLPTTGTLATLAGNETFTNKTLTTPAISSISNSGTVTLPTGTRTLVARDTTDTLTNKTISGSSNTLSNIGNSSLSNSAITIGGTATSLGGTITALTALTDLDLTAGNKTIFDTVGSNTLTIGASGTTISIPGNLTVGGTTTTVNSTTVTIADPIFNLGGTSAPSSDDNKDRGISFRWHNGSAAKIGFFGYDDSTGKLTFIPDATINSEVVSGTAGTIVATTFEGALTGNASTATSAGRWTTARTLSFTGDVTGSGSVHGGGDVATALTIASNAVQAAMVHEDTISGRTELTSGNVDTANDFMLVWDATDQVLKKAKPGSLGISGQAVGSGNELQYNNSNNFAGAANVQIKNASLALKEMAAPSNVSGYGMLYASTNNELYFKDDGGNATQITNGGALAGGGAFRGIKAHLSANNSIGNDSATTPTVWTEVYDVGGFHSGSSNTDRFTFGGTGYYLISIQQEWAADAAGYREMQVERVDTSASTHDGIILKDRMDGSSNTTVSGASTTVYIDDATDYLKVNLYQNSGAALNAIGGTGDVDSTTITITRLDMASAVSNSAGGSGYVQISDGSGGFTYDNNNFFWDVTNNRLGVGTASPSYSIDTTASGTVRAATFTGNLTGNVTGNTSGTAATVTGAAQTAITSLGTLTALTVDNVAIDGTNIGHTSDTDLLVLGNATLTINGATTINQHLTVGATNTGNNRFLTFLTDDGYASGIVMGNNSDADRAWLKYYGGDDSPADQMELKVTGSAHSRYQVASNVATVAFQASSGAKLSTTSGDMTIEVAGNNVVVKGTGSAASFLDIDSVSGQNSRLRFLNGTTAKWNVGNDVGASNNFTIYNQAASANSIQITAANTITLGGNTTLSGDLTIQADGYIAFGDTTHLIDVNAGYMVFKMPTNEDFYWQQGSTNVMHLDTSTNHLMLGGDDAVNGLMSIFGGGSGNAEGGELRLFTSADHDSTYNYYFFDAFQDDLRIGRAGIVDLQIEADGDISFNGHKDFRFGAGGAFNGIKYFDLHNQSATAVTDAIDLRLITRNTANDGTSAVNILKRYNGQFTINNADTHANAYMQMYVGSTTTNGIHINSSGNVGMGVSDPDHRLEINNTDGASMLKLERTGGNAGVASFNIGGADPALNLVITGTSADFTVNTGGSRRLRVASGGTVAVGDFDNNVGAITGQLAIGAQGGSGKYFRFMDTASSPSKYNFQIGVQEVDNAMTLSHSTAVGGTTFSPALAVTHEGDVRLYGDATNATWDASQNRLEFADSSAAVFGTGGDLVITHASNETTMTLNNSEPLRVTGSTMAITPSGNPTNNPTNKQDMELNVIGATEGIVQVSGWGNAGNAWYTVVLGAGINDKSGGTSVKGFVGTTGNQNFGLLVNGSVRAQLETDGDFHVDGDVYAFSGSVSSDIALKENINIVDNALDKVSKLRGVSFDWKREGKGSSIGLIAQDVEPILPELVSEAPTFGDSTDTHKTLNYNGIIGLLVESIKELKDEIQELKNANRR